MTAPKRLTPEALAAIEEGLSTFPDSPRRSAERLLIAEVRSAWIERGVSESVNRIHERTEAQLLSRAEAAEARVAELERAEQSIASLANFIRDREGEIDWPKLPAGRAISTIKALDERVAELLQAQESRFDCHAGPGTSTPACGGCTACLTNRVAELEASASGPPESGRVYWFAETDPIESPPRYLVRGAPGNPAHLTTDPLKAARFDTREDCLAACCNLAVRVLLDPVRLSPVEHMFMGSAEVRR